MDIEDHPTFYKFSKEDETFKRIGRLMLNDLIKMPQSAYNTNDSFSNTMKDLVKRYKAIIPKRIIGEVYKELNQENQSHYPMIESLRIILMKRAVRSASGIVNISIVMPPNKFSCKYNCHFCPNETIANGGTTDMPRSYLSNEDAIARAHKVDFITTKQVDSRFKTLEANGHPIDKIEFRILGGTFSCYDHQIADEFIRDLYYSANTYYDISKRTPLTLEDEQHRNTTAKIHVVGLGVETRPDEITPTEIARFRKYGVTRVEIGVQHTNDDLLRKVNRGHGIKQSKRAIKLLKEYGFKVEIHIMTDLPGATPEMDKECYRLVLKDDPDLIPDYMKDYPCLDVKFTEIKRWKEDGRWQPYAEKTPDARHLKDVLIYRQQITPKWVRVNRIQRDFASASESNDYMGFTSNSIKSNLGEIVKKEAEKQGIYCQCIRCCEIRHEAFDPNNIKYYVSAFQASDAKEYFISAEIDRPRRPLLLGFIRLRLCTTLNDPMKPPIIPELQGKTAMIRELHVYGHVKPVGTDSSSGAQHLGIGSMLLSIAEHHAIVHKYTQMAIIAGIGVRDYYRKRGYELKGTYMMKPLQSQKYALTYIVILCMYVIILLIRYSTRK